MRCPIETRLEQNLVRPADVLRVMAGKTIAWINPECKARIDITAEKIRNMLDVGTCQCEKVWCMINKE